MGGGGIARVVSPRSEFEGLVLRSGRVREEGEAAFPRGWERARGDSNGRNERLTAVARRRREKGETGLYCIGSL